jgi:hypothetical protein
VDNKKEWKPGQRRKSWLQPLDPAYVKLQKHWYDILKQSGFRDLEFRRADGHMCPRLLTESIGALIKQYRPESAYYFRKADWYRYHGQFETEKERQIWVMHCDGKHNPEIARAIGSNKECVRRALNKIKTRMLADGRYEMMDAEQIATLAERINDE